MKNWLPGLSLYVIILLFPENTFAHAFGKLYNLPVPFWLYLYGGAAAIFVSFIIIGYFINRTRKNSTYFTYDLSKKPLVNALLGDRFINGLKYSSVFLFLLTITTGLVGEDNSNSNFNMTFFWIIFTLGLTYLSALLGNIYSLINPWKILIDRVEGFLGHKIEGTLKYPEWLAYWPALLFYFLFIWIELSGQVTPYKLSSILILYTLINFLGVYLYGTQTWFRFGEVFSVFFSLISKISPFEIKSRKLYLRPPFIGLLNNKAEHLSLLLFILFMLSSTAYDGIRETQPWFKFYWWYLADYFKLIFTGSAYSVFQTLSLVLSPLVFLIIYLLLVMLAKKIAQSKLSLYELSLQFAFSLIPIAFVYNFAHYYTLLLTQGQEVIRLISDPFGFGWNLFSTIDYKPNLSIIDANVTWHTQVAVILIGHIAGVYLAHLVALNIFPSHKKALLSQFPMLILMVSYTMIGLWILSQPITSGL